MRALLAGVLAYAIPFAALGEEPAPPAPAPSAAPAPIGDGPKGYVCAKTFAPLHEGPDAPVLDNGTRCYMNVKWLPGALGGKQLGLRDDGSVVWREFVKAP